MRSKQPIRPLALLAPRDQYRQVQAHTTYGKASSPYATNPPEHQPTRWHIWYDGCGIISLLCEGNGPLRKWMDGPKIEIADLINGDGMIDAAMSILHGTYGKKVKGLGVIIHMADCPGQNAVVAAYDDITRLYEVRTLVTDDPKQVVLGTTPEIISANRWRAFPVEGAADNKIVFPRIPIADMEGAIKLSLVDAPISVTLRCAQAEAITATSRLVEGITAEGIGEDGAPYARLVILHYSKVTNLTLYDPKGVPSATRHLTHAEGRISKQMVEEYQLLLRAVPSDIKDVQVTSFCFAGEDDETTMAVETELRKTQVSDKLNIVIQTMPRKLMGDLIATVMGQNIDIGETPFPAECVLEYDSYLLSDEKGGQKKHTARMLECSMDNYIDETTASRNAAIGLGDMRLFVALKLLKRVGILLLIAIIGLLAVKVFVTTQSKEWKLDQESLTKSKTRQAELAKESVEATQITSMIAPTGLMWQNMELVLALFPESKNLILTDMRFDCDTKAKTQHWVFTGVANEDGMAVIRNMQNPTALESIIRGVSENVQGREGIFDPSSIKNVSVREDASDATGVSREINGKSVHFVVDLACSSPQRPLRNR